jgi:hypothetical protein
MERIEGSSALAERVNALGPGDVAVFDYDRTINNARAGWKVDASANEAAKVRGGARTLEALRAAKDRGVHMCIVSARPGTVLESVIIGMKLTPTVASVFDAANEFNRGSVLVLDAPGQSRSAFGRVYCVGYDKSFGIAHFLQSLRLSPDPARPVRLLFVDDYSPNVRAVFMDAEAGKFAAAVPGVDIQTMALWWDTIAEERTGEMDTLVNSGENSYDRELFGLTKLFFASEAEALAKQAESVALERAKVEQIAVARAAAAADKAGAGAGAAAEGAKGVGGMSGMFQCPIPGNA